MLVNVPVADKDKKASIMGSEQLMAAIAQTEAELADTGRVLVRPSGTEPLIRVMIEAKEEATAQVQAQKLADLIKTL